MLAFVVKKRWQLSTYTYSARFDIILNIVAKAIGTIRFSQQLLLLLPLLIIHGARKQQASDKKTVEKLG